MDRHTARVCPEMEGVTRGAVPPRQSPRSALTAESAGSDSIDVRQLL
ncbi:MAG: hypothetical protein AVDCRST_MAG67-2278 [uncultured Solirubrobacteraceae bacterium]|uniref:Uncharacterized protein n=1 Tax=uncultured Solirubrobacteraceae bacterium TaxID=1162706 RepID=A0A6J4STP2_9ACTN|nr:MAG: hypothetical protein AVDCRST_MAG67-2278 [uncultured Solirubrobacteraceae bacterium]